MQQITSRLLSLEPAVMHLVSKEVSGCRPSGAPGRFSRRSGFGAFVRLAWRVEYYMNVREGAPLVSLVSWDCRKVNVGDEHSHNSFIAFSP